MATAVTSVLALGVLGLTSVGTVLSAVPAAAAPSNTLTLDVVSARTEPRAFQGDGVDKGAAVGTFRFLVNLDTTGGTDVREATGPCSPNYVPPAGEPGYPASCPWTSINPAPDAAPIVAQGTQADLVSLDLPDGDYLVSVLADGYKLDGEHFTMPIDGPVTVELQPMPLPDSTIRGQVFEDRAPTNGAYDVGDTPLEGFQGHLNDLLGEVTTDVYGNPLCTTYEGERADHTIPLASLDDEMLPIVETIGGQCLSDADGVVTFPHMGTNRYTQFVTPPDAENWLQTTTLEGHSDWDAWVMEGSTGFDTEFTLAGEAVPLPLFGFVQPLKNGQPLSGSGGQLSGRVMKTLHYVPPKGGYFDLYKGFTGSKLDGPITDAWLSLADLEDGDQAVWIGQAGPGGRFDITGVPGGTYLLSWWDEAQRHLLGLQQVTVGPDESVDLGMLPVTGWWTEVSGYVFDDTNRNGVRDQGEKGIPNFAITHRKRDNSLMDRGLSTAVTDAKGFYTFDAYPLGEFGWTVFEAYSDSYYTTGVTYQADNQPEPTTIKGAGVDVSALNIIGLTGTMDWGVHSYDASGANGVDPQNGGIVGSISYDTTRNELDPRYAGAEDWQPGVPNIPVELWSTVSCNAAPTAPCDTETGNALADDGSYLPGNLLNTYLSEQWGKPTGCTARDVDGNPLLHGIDEGVLALDQETDGVCIPAFSQSFQFGNYPTDQGTPDANFGATVDGNYGFGDGCLNGTVTATDVANPTCDAPEGFETLPAGDYLVRLAIPEDGLTGNPLYKVSQEEDINVANGNQIIPQVPPPACAGALHTIDLLGDADDGYPEIVGTGANGVPVGVTVPGSTPVENAPFLDMGGSIYEGDPKPGCGTKLVELNNGKSIVPMFQIFTDVPLPSRLRGLIIDDVNFSADIASTSYGEKAGVPFVPVGIYDFANRLVTTLESDYNGFYDVLLPSTNHISCPTPAGVCAGMYRFVGNDPGVPGRLNRNYNPRFRVIGTEFEAIPGVTIPTDLAPTQVGMTLTRPGTGQRDFVTCPIGEATPQLLAVSQPYVNGTGSFTIEGTGFGTTPGTVSLGGTALPVSSWSNTQINVTVPAGTPARPHQLGITGSNGSAATNALTFHVLGAGYDPRVREVGEGREYATIQAALNAAHSDAQDDLVVVYPGTPDLTNPQLNPRGAYYENLVMASPVKLQGVGPGGFQGDTFVAGSIIDGGAFSGDTAIGDAWYDLVGSLAWDGNQSVNDGQAIYVLASQNETNGDGQARQFTGGFKATIDGFDIRGGNQQGFPGNVNDRSGEPTGLPANITTQGGAVFANSYARHLQITNNVVENNGGGYGTIRFGTPDLQGQNTDQHNEDARIAHNRIVANAGTNLAGAVGMFAGSDRYQIDHNDICGNFSLEYGGGVSVYGHSPNGRIHHNRIYYNESGDEGGGIMIAGALPADPDQLSEGTGPVDIYANQIQANLANDDGGGIRFLMAGADRMNVVNNTIVNNVSTHEGGGISLNDAPYVHIVNNTVMKNLTTATAVTSNGVAAPAGLSTAPNSDQLQATLPGGAPTFSDPRLLNNIFWDNRAATRAGLTVTGIGLPGDVTPVEHWDLGMFEGSAMLSPTHSVVQQDPAQHGYSVDPSNSDQDPEVVSTYDVSVAFATWRQNPAFVDSTLVALQAPGDQLGDYHLADCDTTPSPACNLGAASAGGASAPSTDIDDEVRPALGGYDAGSDEFGSTPADDPTTPGATELLFSTLGTTNPPGVTGTADDADIYRWSGSSFSRQIDVTAAPYNLSAIFSEVDGFSRVDASRFYMSFSGILTPVPGLGLVQDEDVVYWDGSAWKLAFDGTAQGLTSTSHDIDALSVSYPDIYFSTVGDANPPGVGGSADDADIYRWDGTSYSRVWDASEQGLSGAANVDGLDRISADEAFVSFSSTTTSVPGLGNVNDEDVVRHQGNTWSLTFDGAAVGMTSPDQDIDAFSLADTASPPPPAVAATLPPFGALFLSRVSVAGATASIYGWDGTEFGPHLDVTAPPYNLPASAKVDGIDLVGDGNFYLSLSRNTVVPGLGTVQDEDVVYWDDSGYWELFFDGTGAGLTRRAQDIGDITIVGHKVYFTTLGNAKPPGVRGRGDNADVYVWTGRKFRRVWDATKAGVQVRAAVDGLAWVGKGELYVSFSGNRTKLPGLGVVRDEDVVHRRGPSWSMYFDGGLQDLVGEDDDVNAFDIPPTDPDAEEGVNTP